MDEQNKKITDALIAAQEAILAGQEAILFHAASVAKSHEHKRIKQDIARQVFLALGVKDGTNMEEDSNNMQEDSNNVEEDSKNLEEDSINVEEDSKPAADPQDSS